MEVAGCETKAAGISYGEECAPGVYCTGTWSAVDISTNLLPE
jgi:hypothetical protein